MELFSTIPLWYQISVVLGLGLIFGSFFNVYLYRFHTGRSLSGSSHCLSCAKPLRWYELLPVVSYVALRGRCSGCGSYIPWRYALVELATGLLFVLGWLQASTVWELLWWWAILSVLLLIFVYDIYHYIIPNEFTAALLALVMGPWLIAAIAGESAWLTLGYTTAAALAAAAFFAGLWWYSAGTWVGFGDAKLAVPLGLLVGYESVFTFVVLAFWIGAGVSVLLLLIQYLRRRGQPHLRSVAGKLTMKSAVPFAPFLLAAALLTRLTNFNVLSLFQ